MIESQNPDVDVDMLMARLRERVAELRERPRAKISINALTLRSSVFINSLEALVNIADQKSQIRTQWPSHLASTFPFSVARIRDVTLQTLAFVFKDQRHVNQALVSAMRDQINLNRHLIEQIDFLRDQLETRSSQA